MNNNQMLPTPARVFLDEIKKLQTLPFNHRLRLARSLLPYSNGDFRNMIGNVSEIALNSASYLAAILACEAFQKRLLVVYGSKHHIPFIDECLKMDPRLLNHCDRLTHQTPLALAVRHGYNGVVERLLKESAIDVNKPTRPRIGDETPLMIAIRTENLQVIQMFLERDDVDVNYRNFKGDTAIQMMKPLLDKYQKSLHEAAAVLNFLKAQNTKPLRFFDDKGKEVSRAQAFMAAWERVYEDEKPPETMAIDVERYANDVFIADPDKLLDAIQRNELLLIKKCLAPVFLNQDYDVHCPYCADPLGFEKRTQKEHFMCKCPACFNVFMAARGPLAHVSKRAIETAQTICDQETARFTEVDNLFQILLTKNNRKLHWSENMPMNDVIKAIDTGNVTRLKELMAFDAFNVNSVISNGQSLLHYSIEKNRYQIAKELLKHPEICVNYGGYKYRYGGEGEFYSTKYYTPFHAAINYEQDVYVRLLLEHPEISMPDFLSRDFTPFIISHPSFNPNRVFGKRNLTYISKTTIPGTETIQLLLTHPRVGPHLFRTVLTHCIRDSFVGVNEYSHTIEDHEKEALLTLCFEQIKKQKGRHVRWAKFQLMLHYASNGDFERAYQFFDKKTMALLYGRGRPIAEDESSRPLSKYESALHAFIRDSFSRSDETPSVELFSFLFSRLGIQGIFVLELWKRVACSGNLELVQMAVNFLTTNEIDYLHFDVFLHEQKVGTNDPERRIKEECLHHEPNFSCVACHMLINPNEGQIPDDELDPYYLFEYGDEHDSLRKSLITSYQNYVAECLKLLIERKLYTPQTLHLIFQNFCKLRNPHLQTQWLEIIASAPEFDINSVDEIFDQTVLIMLAKAGKHLWFEKEDRCTKLKSRWSPRAQFKRVLHYLLTRFPALDVEWKDSSGKSAVDYCKPCNLLETRLQERKECYEWSRIVKFGHAMPRDITLRVGRFLGSRFTLDGIEATYEKEDLALCEELTQEHRASPTLSDHEDEDEDEDEDDLLAAIMPPTPIQPRQPRRVAPSLELIEQDFQEDENEDEDEIEEEEEEISVDDDDERYVFPTPKIPLNPSITIQTDITTWFQQIRQEETIVFKLGKSKTKEIQNTKITQWLERVPLTNSVVT